MARLSFYSAIIFEPAVSRTLKSAHGEAWECLKQLGTLFLSKGEESVARDALTQGLIEAALMGERDHDKLRDAALKNWCVCTRLA